MKPRAMLAVLAAGAALTGCGGQPSDLQGFVARVKARPAGAIQPIPTIASYQPYRYDSGGRRGPFTPTMPGTEPAPETNGLAPDFARPRDPLEAFPLDALQMVGTITSQGVTYALIHAPDDIIYRAAPGDHIGQRFGDIQSVSDGGVNVVEIVADGNGGYVKRATALAPSK